MLKFIKEHIKENTSLIQSIGANYHKSVEKIILEGYKRGKDLDYIVKALEKRFDISKDKAVRIAVDQTNKITQQTALHRAKEAGIKKGKWNHVPGKFSSRPSHVAMNGKTFDLEKGMYDKDVGRNIQPAELVYCRCNFRLVIPGLED